MRERDRYMKERDRYMRERDRYMKEIIYKREREWDR